MRPTLFALVVAVGCTGTMPNGEGNGTGGTGGSGGSCGLGGAGGGSAGTPVTLAEVKVVKLNGKAALTP